MTVQDTELTFVRCPSCKSLVPAVATRCRMCSHHFDDEGHSSKSNESDENIAETVVEKEKIQESLEGASMERVEDNSPEEKTESIVNTNTPITVEKTTNGEFKREPLSFGQQNSNSLESGLLRQSNSQKKRRRRKRGRRDSSHSLEATGISTLNGETEQSQENHNKEEISMTTNGQTTEERAVNGNSAPISVASKPAPESSSSIDNGPVTSLGEEGKLIGWMVNFAQDPTGVARELRTGQFFIGKQRLRNNDMVLSESTVSTPHALVKANFKDGIRMQDLMSEHGTFVKRAGQNGYNRHYEAITLQHGDWLKLGDHEVLISLLPSPIK